MAQHLQHLRPTRGYYQRPENGGRKDDMNRYYTPCLLQRNSDGTVLSPAVVCGVEIPGLKRGAS